MKRAGREIQAAHVGHRGDAGRDGGRPLFVAAAGQAGETLLSLKDCKGGDADRLTRRSQFPLEVADGEVALAEGDGPLPDAVADGR